MALVRLVMDEFPGLDSESDLFGYRKILIKNLERGTALCAKKDDEIGGVLLYSLNLRKISFLAVHPKHRKQGIGEQLVRHAIEAFPDQVDISVTTFRGDDPRGDAPRALYFKLGFKEDEMVTAYDCPQQVLILKRDSEQV